MNKQEFARLHDLNIELMDCNRNLMSYLIQVYKKNGIVSTEVTHADALLSQVSKVLQKLVKPINRNFTVNKSTADYTAPRKRNNIYNKRVSTK